MSQIDLNLLRIFEVVERERSLTRAARTLFLSQSAVSHAIARLKEQLGAPIFVRQGRSIVPTAFALELAPAVRNALQLLDGAVARQKTFEPSTVQQVRIAIPEEHEPLLVAQLFAALRADAPAVTLTTVRLDRKNLRDDLLSRRIDLAIDVAQVTSDDVMHRLLLRDAFCVLAPKGRRVTRASYEAAEHVTVSSRPSGSVLEDFHFKNENLQRRVALRCQSYESAREAVQHSGLLLTLPRVFTERRKLREGLRVCTPPVPMRALQMHQYWARAFDAEPVVAWAREKVAAAIHARRS